MNYEDLRRFQRLEKNVALGVIDKDFYTRLSELIRYYQPKARESQDDAKILENIIKISRDIFERREQKIVQKALNAVRTGKAVDCESLAPEEKKLLDALVDCLRTSRNNFEAVLSGDIRKELEKIQHIDDIPEIGEAEDLNYILVKIIKKVPKFISDNMKEYGPFEENEIVKLPKREAELLSEKNFAEKI